MTKIVFEDRLYFRENVSYRQNHTHVPENIKISPPIKCYVTCTVDGIHQEGMSNRGMAAGVSSSNILPTGLLPDNATGQTCQQYPAKSCQQNLA